MANKQNTNFLVPKHRKLTKEEILSILEKYEISNVSKLPKIKIKDPAILQLGANLLDVIEIERKSFVGITKYYRVVIE